MSTMKEFDPNGNKGECCCYNYGRNDFACWTLSIYEPGTDNLVNYVKGKHRRKYGKSKVALFNSEHGKLKTGRSVRQRRRTDQARTLPPAHTYSS